MKKIVSLLLSNIAVRVLTTIQGIFIARLFLPSIRGELNVMSTLPAIIAVICNLGFAQAGFYYYKNKKYSLGQALTNIYFCLLSQIALFILLYFIFKPLILSIYPFLGGIIVPLFMLIELVFAVTSNVLNLLVVERGKTNIYAVIQLVIIVLRLIISIIMYVLHYASVEFHLIISSIFVIINIILVMLSAHRRTDFGIRMISIDIIKDFIKYGYKIGAMNVIHTLHYRIDTMLVAAMLTTYDNGIYSLAISCVEILWIIPNTGASFVFIDSAAETEAERANKSAKILINVVLIAAILGAVLAYPAIRFAYGIEYVGACIPLLVLLPGGVLYSAYKLYGNMLAARNKAYKLIIASSIALVFNVALNYLLLPRIGIIGAALSSCLTYSIASIIVVPAAKKELGLSYKQMFFLSKEEWKLAIRSITSKLKEG